MYRSSRLAFYGVRQGLSQTALDLCSLSVADADVCHRGQNLPLHRPLLQQRAPQRVPPMGWWGRALWMRLRQPCWQPPASLTDKLRPRPSMSGSREMAPLPQPSEWSMSNLWIQRSTLMNTKPVQACTWPKHAPANQACLLVVGIFYRCPVS